MALSGKNIVLGVSGGIAAYKAAELCSLLRKAGAAVRVAMTESAARFVAPLTFETLTQYPVCQSIWGGSKTFEMEHISWAKWADLLVIAPATANVIAKMAAGLADDPVTTLYLSFAGPVVVAPAMNSQMLQHPATERNLDTLRANGVAIVDPDTGRLACGDVGPGKLASLDHIMRILQEGGFPSGPAEGLGAPAVRGREIPHRASPSSAAGAAEQAPAPPADVDDSLSGKTVLITSGPTHEYIDPVRFLTNPSSGKMGAALAREAARRSASILFVSGPVSVSALPSECAKIYRITSAEQMLRTVQSLAQDVDIFVFAAAVSDFKIASAPSQKIKRTGNNLSLPLVENPDIAQAVGYSKQPGQITVGFAAETNDMEQNALTKLERKHLDAIVANNVSDPRIGFDRDDNEVTIYLRGGQRVHVSRRPKTEVARDIFSAIVQILNSEV